MSRLTLLLKPGRDAILCVPILLRLTVLLTLLLVLASRPAIAQSLDSAHPPSTPPPNSQPSALSSQLPFPPTAPPEAFDVANKLYDQGQFAQAADAYQQLLQAGHQSPVILFNLGNAQFKAARIGQAIVAYRQAASLSPRDPDLRANLSFARKQVQGPTLAPAATAGFLQRLTVNEWSVLASIPLWAGCLGLALGHLLPKLKPTLRWPVRACLSATVFLGVLAALALQQTQARIAVVVVESVPIHKGPMDESATAFTAQDGAELRVLDEKGDWYQVAASLRQQGWLPKRKVVILP